MAINTLTVHGYRSIQKLCLPMDTVNVVTGWNGCGKSNLYKAVYLLAKAANGELAKILALEGGMPSALWTGEKTTRTKYSVRLILSIQADHFSYEIACGLPPPSLSVFTLDPLVQEEHDWYGDVRHPSNTSLERQAGSAWITNQKG